MTEIYTANIGSYPRIGEEKDHQRHRRALTHLQNREISSHAFHDVEQSVIQEVVREQIIGGLDEVTDGHVSRHDAISFFCRKIPGLKLKGLTRYFDTNTYFRQPTFTGKPRLKSPEVTNDFIFAQSISNKPIRVVLTGPYTLAVHTKSDYKGLTKLPARISFFTDLLKLEIKKLVAQGAKIIQIDEPAIAVYPEDIVVFKKTMEDLSESLKNVRSVLTLTYRPLAPLYFQVRNLPFDVLNLDFTYDGKKLLDLLFQNPPSMAVGFGLVNGRNTKPEAIDSIIKVLKDFSEKVNPEYMYLTPSCGLEHLPRKFAFEKVQLIYKVKEEILKSRKT